MTRYKKSTKGSFEIICGSMFSGKSEELIRRVKRAQIAQLTTLVFKHSLDDRTTVEYIHAHGGDKLQAIAIDQASQMRELVFDEVEVVGIDEVQFFHTEVIEVILELVDQGKRVIAAGLDLDFRGLPFGPMASLLALADHVTKLKAVCISCGSDAHYTQRLVNGKPAKFTDPVIFIGAEECYQARCRDCYLIDRKPHFIHGQK